MVFFLVAETESDADKHALELSEEFRRAIDYAPVPTIIQAEDGQILQISRSWTESTGCKLNDFSTFDSWLTNTVDGADVVRNSMRELFHGDKRSINVEFTVRTHNKGSLVWSFSASSLGTLQDGRRFSIGTAVDITKHKETEEALKESDEKYQLIVETSGEGIWVATPDGKATFVNQKMADMLGYSKEEILGKPGLDFLDKSQTTDVLKNRKTLSRKGTVQFECEFIRKDGSTLWTLVNASPVFNEKEEHIANINMHTDITKRKKAEEALKKTKAQLERYSKNLESLVKERTKQLQEKERLAAIGETAGMVGHDIRNPLQAIAGDVYLLKDYLKSIPESPTKEDVTESLEAIEKNVVYINKVVADLQDYSRKINPEYTNTNLYDLVENVFRPIIIPENIKSTIEIDHKIKLKIDATLFRRILTNLIINAIQAMPKGGELAVKAEKKSDSINVSVEDTGVGIPDEIKPKMFTPMMTTKAKGQGLGLAVAKRLVESMSGTIDFESEFGKGTKFIIKLPLC
ncbi:MAG: PAS domain-containing sensor histidine kinase [Candidatus Bathyarchaeia archaeon]|jgi:PAS domain S-box-containing protein